jgi:hypothetical protein
MESQPKRYWFHAKKYGWGWGLPATREGWIVFVLWYLVVTAGAIALAVTAHWILFAVFMVAMSAGLIAICYAKGEPPRWRWGDN